MKRLFKFCWDCGRTGYLESLFVATQEQVDAAIGKYLYFGEVLGKHSEISGTLEASDIQDTGAGPEVVEFFEKLGCIGHNPLKAISEDEE